MDLEKVYIFLEKNKMTFEELGMLLTIYYRNTNEEVNRKANSYYNNDFQKYIISGVIHTIQYKDIVDKLISKDLIEDLRNDREKKENHVKFSKLKVSAVFIDFYFVQQDTAYQMALKLYPDFIMADSNGTRHQTKTVNHIHYANVFYNKVLNGGDKEEFDFFCFMTKEKFDYCPIYDVDSNEIGGEPNYAAITKWDKYLDEYQTLKKDFKKDLLSNNSWS